MTTMSITAQRPAQLERPDRRRPLGRAHRAPARRLVGRGGRRRADRRADHADPRPHEHELPHPLRPLPHSRAGATSWASPRRSGWRSWPTRPCAPCSTSGPTARRPACSAGLSHWGTYIIGDTYAPANEGCAGRDRRRHRRRAGHRARSTPCSTSCWPTSCAPCCGPTPTTATRRPGPCARTIWSDPRAMVGGSDAGAHLDRMCGSNYPTAFLADCLRGRQLVPVERAVQMMTEPAGRSSSACASAAWSAEGYAADLFVFDPETVGSEPARLVHDLPGDTPRLYRRLARGGPGAGQRRRDRPRRRAHRRGPRARCCAPAATPPRSFRPPPEPRPTAAAV